MLTVLGFFRRRPDLTHEQFSAHWRDVHAPLVRDTPAVARHLVRYVQHHVSPCHVFPELFSIGYDGFSETWFDSAASLQAMRAEPAYAEQILPDLLEFLDHDLTRTTVLDEQHLVIGSALL